MTDAPSPRVAIFTVTFDRLAYTRRMLETLAASTGVPYDHFVIDNGSGDGTVAFLTERRARFAGLRLNPSNMGLDEATNQALEMIGHDYDYILKADNDCEFVDADWLETLLQVAEASGRRMALSPRTEGLGPGEYDGGHPRTRWFERAGHAVGLADHVGGLCLLAPAWMYDGFRYKKNPMHGNQDVLFSLHVRLELGCQMAYVEDVRVRHMDTTDGQLQRFPEYFAARREQQRRVYGESSLTTALLAVPRRAVLRWRMARAGLLEGGLARYLFRRLAARFGHAPPPGLESLDGTGRAPRPGPRVPPSGLPERREAGREAWRGAP